ncbi:hypothetical protein H0P79_004835 [Salmonella enterica]|nr:hypothetical protein [Salmonella enterica]
MKVNEKFEEGNRAAKKMLYALCFISINCTNTNTLGPLYKKSGSVALSN